jgi:ADP-heptose:LPS heptosyltransferase
MKMSSILFTLKYGVGNVVQSIPAYLNIKEKHDVRLVYEPIFKTDSVARAKFFPDHVEEMNIVDVSNLSKKMDYEVNIPYGIVAVKGEDFHREVLDDLSEAQSEVERSMVYCRHLGCSTDIKRDSVPVRHLDGWDDRKYVIIHNGSLGVDSWRMKKYPLMERLVLLIKKELGLECASIGSKEEYVKGTVDLTGKEMMESAWHIKNSRFYVGTDSGMYHVAGYLEVPGVVLFTATSPTKNWDKRFHHTITPIKTTGCKYGQWGYHWHPHCAKCREGALYHPCQTIDPHEILETIAGRL